MVIDCIIQARMTSSRLPGKVMIEFGGYPLLHHIICRLKKAHSLRRIIVATSMDSTDDIIADYCNRSNIFLFRGSMDDVLERYYSAANHFECENILRVTADCPFIDALLIDSAAEIFKRDSYDLFGLGGNFPDGLDFTFFTRQALHRAHNNAKLKSEREHVCLNMEKYENRTGAFEPFFDVQWLRLTLDEERDYKMIAALYNIDERIFEMNFYDIFNLLNKHKEILDINSGILRNEGLQKSLEND